MIAARSGVVTEIGSTVRGRARSTCPRLADLRIASWGLSAHELSLQQVLQSGIACTLGSKVPANLIVSFGLATRACVGHSVQFVPSGSTQTARQMWFCPTRIVSIRSAVRKYPTVGHYTHSAEAISAARLYVSISVQGPSCARLQPPCWFSNNRQ